MVYLTGGFSTALRYDLGAQHFGLSVSGRQLNHLDFPVYAAGIGLHLSHYIVFILYRSATLIQGAIGKTEGRVVYSEDARGGLWPFRRRK